MENPFRPTAGATPHDLVGRGGCWTNSLTASELVQEPRACLLSSPEPGHRQRTGMRPNAVGNYRTRLLATGLIEPAGHGLVDFAIPGLREYLRPRPRSLAEVPLSPAGESDA